MQACLGISHDRQRDYPFPSHSNKDQKHGEQCSDRRIWGAGEGRKHLQPAGARKTEPYRRRRRGKKGAKGGRGRGTTVGGGDRDLGEEKKRAERWERNID